MTHPLPLLHMNLPPRRVKNKYNNTSNGRISATKYKHGKPEQLLPEPTLLGKKERIIVENIDIRNYAKYLLQEGKDIEKRELLSCLKSRLQLLEKKIRLV